MYKRILLATDVSRESAIALREGALLAQAYAAKAFLLVVDRESPGARIANSISPFAAGEEPQQLLAYGLARLAGLGVSATGEVVIGEPAIQIGAYSKRFKADLVVVGHRRQSLLDRWWSGGSGAYLADTVACSVLIARDVISDEEFEGHIAARKEVR